MPKNKYHFFTQFCIGLVFCLVSVSCLFFPLVPRALGVGGVGGVPAYPDPNIKYSDSWFIYNLDKGETKEDGIKVVNSSNEEKTIKVYPVDATVTIQGAFASLAESDPKKGIGAWIKLSVSEVILEPQTERIIPFTITIPENADVGDHLGAVMIEEVKPAAQTGGTGFIIIARVGIRVYQTVPGEIIKILKISNISWGIGIKSLSSQPTTGEKIKTAFGLRKEGVFTLGLKNEGNVHLNPSAFIEIIDIFGSHVATLKSSLGITGSGGTTSILVKWEKPSLFGRFTANVDVFFGEGQKTSTKISFWIVPWTIVAVIVGLIIILVFIKLFWTLFYLIVKKSRMLPYKVTKKETLTDIAEKFNVKWKKLARINNLKPPYELKEDQTLYIPKKKK